MDTFRKNFSYGTIKEVGEKDILVNIDGEDVVMELTESNRKPIFEAVEEGIFIVPVDAEKKKLLMTVDTKTLYEVFPELDLKELKGSTDSFEEHE
ncbi:MAG: hypothetical protein ACI35O_16440 [Bacillaceae bacterium]